MSFSLGQPSVAYRTDHMVEKFQRMKEGGVVYEGGVMDRMKSFWKDFSRFKDGGVVSPQSGAYGLPGPKFGLMPVKDRFQLMKEGGVAPTFELKNVPVHAPSDYFLNHQLNYNKLYV